MKQKEKVSITIVWGSDREERKTYTFNNNHDKDMFMKGVDEAEGWLEYDIVTETTRRVETPEERAERIKRDNANIQRVDSETKVNRLRQKGVI